MSDNRREDLRKANEEASYRCNKERYDNWRKQNPGHPRPSNIDKFVSDLRNLD